MGDYKKMVEEGLKSNEREVKDMPIDLVLRRLWIILRAPTAPCLHHTAMASCSLAALAWADAHWCLSSPTFNDSQSLPPRRHRSNDNKDWKRELKQVR